MGNVCHNALKCKPSAAATGKGKRNSSEINRSLVVARQHSRFGIKFASYILPVVRRSATEFR